MFGGPSGSGGTGSNPTTAQVYLPANQPRADQAFWQALNNLSGSYQAGRTPGQFAYPMLQQDVTQAQNAPWFGTALQGTAEVANRGQNVGLRDIGYANQLFSTGFDPQQALYNQQFQQQQNQQNAVNAMSGIAGTPYGAAITGQQNQNFNMNWLNNQLNREATAAGAAGPLASTGLSAIASSAAGPYNLWQSRDQNALNALQQFIQAGNLKYSIPQQVISDANQYMGLGQSASQISGQLGQMGVNQTYQGLEGLGALGILGSQGSGLFGGGGLLGTGLGAGLFGAGSAAADSSFLLPGTASVFGGAADALGPFAAAAFL